VRGNRQQVMGVRERLASEVINAGLCVGCGACVAGVAGKQARMVRRPGGLEPDFRSDSEDLDELFWEACPGKGVDYPRLYRAHYGQLPDDWRVGIVRRVWIGYSADPAVRRAGASGGVMTAVLMYLLETGRINGAILVRQGKPGPEEASYQVARSREEILACAQSVYIPVSVLDALRELVPGERYAMTCLPEQSAALRVLQHGGDSRASQVAYVLGPYTGTALEYGVIGALLRQHRVAKEDRIVSLRWRAGEWPGHLEIRTAEGRIIRSPKIYYNYLIPFYITRASLQSMDFANEFADLSVGDAWSPKYEALGEGFSVIVARSKEMEHIILKMKEEGLLVLEEQDISAASKMHGHMIDFKKRGSYLRNQMRRLFGRPAPDYGLRPIPLGLSRVLVECFVYLVFVICHTRLARWFMERLPVSILGPAFNRLRLAWKAVSKPSKRRGLGKLQMITYIPRWRTD